MSEQLRGDSAPGAIAQGGKTSRRRLLTGIGIGVSGTLVLGGIGGYVAAKEGAFDGIIQDVLHGDGSAFRQAWWHEEIPVDAKEIVKWPSVEGDPGADPLDMKTWKVSLFSTPREAFEDQRRDLNGQDAVGYEVGDGLVDVATMPNGDPFLNSLRHDPDTLHVGLRVGRGVLRASPGLWLPEQERFVPAVVGASVLSHRIEQIDMARSAPGIIYS